MYLAPAEQTPALSGALELLKIKTDLGVREVYLRQGTSDTMLVGQMFVDDALDLSVCPRVAELECWLSQCRRNGLRPLIVDGGANIGLTSVLFAAQVPDALIVAIEPEPENFTLLVANTEGLSVVPVPAALMRDPGRVEIEDPGGGAWAFRTRPTDQLTSNTVCAVNIDEIFAAHADSFLPFIVKIDIEGAEKDVFDGPAEWIDQVPLIIVELHDWMLPGARSAQPVLRRLLQSDRDFVFAGENLFSMPVELSGICK
jgi:FkbM family methyltransferase